MPPLYPVIMAGGSGTRFWPLSRQRTPKQVLAILGPSSLLQDTVDRIRGLAPTEQVRIATNARQFKVIAPQLPELSPANFLLEPSPRNTAPCIGLAAVHIRKRDPDGIMLVLPSDHIVRDVKAFQEAVRRGVEVVERHDPLVTFGIRPDRPETGYGYIQYVPSQEELPAGVHRVKAFAEKPNLQTAQMFLQSGDFYWNSGMFIWRASRILQEMEEHLPEHYHQLVEIERAIGKPNYQRILNNRYRRLRAISIDYGVMEVSRTPIFMLAGEFGWNDVGSWDELYRIASKGKDGNVAVGDTVALDSHNNYIYSPSRLTAVIGMDDVLIVNTPNATLICPRSRAQDVKAVVDKLRQERKDKYL